MRKTMPACGGNCYRRRDSPRRLIGDDKALVAALKREKAMGVNEGVTGRG
jgi:hypothetical protein